MSPVSEEVNFVIQHDDEIDVIHRTEGLENYLGYLKYSRKYDDTWVGMGFSYEISDNFSFGVSSFLSIKTMRYIYQQDAEAYQEKDSVIVNNQNVVRYIAESNFKEEMKYWDLSFVFKLGGKFKTNNERFSAGINFTFPNIHLYGEGDIRKSYTRSNIYDNEKDQFTSNDSYLAYEKKVNSLVKSPFSLAVGIQYFTKHRKNFISLTGEYFHNIDPYAVVSISSPQEPDYLFNSVNNNPLLAYYSEARSVTNFGIGFKQTLSPTVFILSGFRTDFSVASTSDQGSVFDEEKINRIHMDKYHFSFGPVFSIKKFNIITGVQYTYGRNNDILQMVNLSDPVEYIRPLINHYSVEDKTTATQVLMRFPCS